MKPFRSVMPVMLLGALMFAGCADERVLQHPTAGIPTVKPLSCIDRSAAVRPPRNAIVELAWCIAETDDLYDPDHLFHETLEINNEKRYDNLENVKWGIKVGARGEEIRHLPGGIVGLMFMRIDPKSTVSDGQRYLSFEVDSTLACIRFKDISFTFGAQYWISPPPITAPIRATLELSKTPTVDGQNFYSIFFKLPDFFEGDGGGSVHFDFDYQECVRSVSIKRELNFVFHKQHERKK